MSVVVDANVVVALGTANASTLAAHEHLAKWRASAEDLHVPQLFPYELASALSGLEAEGSLTSPASDAVWTLVDTLDLTLHPPSSGPVLVAITRRLRRRSSYDAAYLDLALQLQAIFWTLDGKLARNAEAVGLPVRLLV